jgi:hypothetical protein
MNGGGGGDVVSVDGLVMEMIEQAVLAGRSRSRALTCSRRDVFSLLAEADGYSARVGALAAAIGGTTAKPIARLVVRDRPGSR